MVLSLFSAYSIHTSLGSYWLGVKRIDGKWIKNNRDKMQSIDAEIVNPDSDGDCMISDSENYFRAKIVNCQDKYKVS